MIKEFTSSSSFHKDMHEADVTVKHDFDHKHDVDIDELIKKIEDRIEDKLKAVKKHVADVKKHLPEPPSKDDWKDKWDDHPEIACVMVPEAGKDWDGCLPDSIC